MDNVIEKNIELTKNLMDATINSLMRIRRFDEVTGTMDNTTFDAMLDEVCKEKWGKYSKMDKQDIIAEMLKEMLSDL